MRKICLAILLFLNSTFVFSADSPLTLGIFPYVSRGQLMEFHTPLKLYLETHLRRPVELVTAPDFIEFISRTQKGDFDLILTAPHMGRLAEKRDNYKRLVKTGHEVQGIFLARKDSTIRKLEDLNGKSIMMAQPTSIIYQMSLEHLRKKGLVPGKNITVIGSRTHNNALYAPARRETDASVTGQLLWHGAEPEIRSQLVVIGQTRSVPGFMLMANSRMPSTETLKIQQLLLNFHKTPEGRAYFEATALKGFNKINDMTMKSLDPYTRILTEQPPPPSTP